MRQLLMVIFVFSLLGCNGKDEQLISPEPVALADSQSYETLSPFLKSIVHKEACSGEKSNFYMVGEYSESDLDEDFWVMELTLYLGKQGRGKLHYISYKTTELFSYQNSVTEGSMDIEWTVMDSPFEAINIKRKSDGKNLVLTKQRLVEGHISTYEVLGEAMDFFDSLDIPVPGLGIDFLGHPSSNEDEIKPEGIDAFKACSQ